MSTAGYGSKVAVMSLLCGVLAASAADQPLPDPDGKPADMNQKVKVLILLGQSNMLGFGRVPAGKKPEGSLEHAVKEKGLYQHLIDDEGNWTTRQDVRFVRVMNDREFNNEFMTVKGNFGPEIGIGHYVGNATDAPVMVLKSCIGNRSLGWDLLPPGSPRTTHDGKEVPGYREYSDGGKVLPYEEGVSKVIATKGRNKGKEVDPWYAGKQYDSDVAAAKRVLADLDKYYPGAKGYEVVGFCWWQGDKDRYNAAHAGAYEKNLVQLIKALRKEFDAPDAKFVIATLGQTAKDTQNANEKKILDAMMAVDGDSGKYPELKGSVATVYTNPLSKGGASNGHYSKHAETYMNVGEAMGEAMAELLAE